MDPTPVFHAHPWAAALLWTALHATDWFLTIAGARRYAASSLRYGGGYELNPLFAAVVAEGRWLSGRFLVTLALGALAFWGCAALVSGWLLAFVLGMLLFTRAAVVARHLANLASFRRRRLQPQSFAGRSSLSADVVLRISAAQIGQSAAVLWLAAALTASPWLLGGASGQTLHALKHALRAWRLGPQAAPEPAASA